MSVDFAELNFPVAGFFGAFLKCGKRLFSGCAEVPRASELPLAKSLAISNLPHFADWGEANCGRALRQAGERTDLACRTKEIHRGQAMVLRALTSAAANSLRELDNLGWTVEAATRTAFAARSIPRSIRDLGAFAA
jgi:hypothetical protein